MVYIRFIALKGFITQGVVGVLAQIYREACLPENSGKFTNKDASPKSFQGVYFCFCQHTPPLVFSSNSRPFTFKNKKSPSEQLQRTIYQKYDIILRTSLLNFNLRPLTFDSNSKQSP